MRIQRYGSAEPQQKGHGLEFEPLRPPSAREALEAAETGDLVRERYTLDLLAALLNCGCFGDDDDG